jgi:hypothetical protein
VSGHLVGDHRVGEEHVISGELLRRLGGFDNVVNALIWLPDFFKQTRGLDIRKSWVHLVTIVIGSQLRGDVLGDAGLGYGGYCLPKDIAAFINMAAESGYDFELLKVVQKINENQRQTNSQKSEEDIMESKR